MHNHRLAFLFAACAFFPACGGGSAPAPVTVVLRSSTLLDGYVFDGGVAELGNHIYVGDVTANTSVRGFVSFDLTPLPAGATVTSATLSMYQWVVIGTPYAVLGSQLVDHLDFGATLDPGDFALAALSSGFDTLASDDTIGPKLLSVTAQVVADLTAARVRSQFRIRFAVATDTDASEDSCSFRRADATTASEVPTLSVTYQP